MKTINTLKKYGSRIAIASTGVFVASSAFAVDVTAAVTEIGTGNAAVGAIGVAALTVLAAAAVFKYVRRAL